MATEGVPGKAFVSMDLPKVTHALIFDRHAQMRVNRDHDGLRITLVSGGTSVEMHVDDPTFAALLHLMAVAVEEGAPPDAIQRQPLGRAAERLATALNATRR